MLYFSKIISCEIITKTLIITLLKHFFHGILSNFVIEEHTTQPEVQRHSFQCENDCKINHFSCF